MSILNLIGNIFTPAAKLIDDLHTSEEEKLVQKAQLMKISMNFLEKGLDFELANVQAKTAIILAEAKSESWLTANWRPLTMVSFVGLIGAYWLGLTPDSVPEEAVLAMFSLVKIGLGGYVVGRSAEKVAVPLMEAFKKKEEV